MRLAGSSHTSVGAKRRLVWSDGWKATTKEQKVNMTKHFILTRSALLGKDPEVQRLYSAMAQREPGSDTRLRQRFDGLLRGNLEQVRQRTAVITGAGLGAALVEEIAAAVIDLTTAYSGFKTLNVQTPQSGKARFPVAKVLPDAVAEAPFLTPSSQGTQLTPVATLMGGGEETQSLDLPILIEVSNSLLEDERADLSFALPSLLAKAAANRVDWAAFSADGTDDIQDGGMTGIFRHGEVALVTAAAGHASVEKLSEEDILRTVEATADGALQRGTRWWLREAVKYEVGMMDDIHHGPRQDKLNGAHINRDWSGVAAMDWLCGDDATLEVYFHVPDGKGWFTLMRGQFLPMIDVRSLRVLGFGLRPEKSYNAAMIRTLITRVCDEHGLPRKGFYFERGIWANSRLLKGDMSADPFSWPETELGLRSLGLRFVHSKLPRSKPIERVIGALQDLMEGEPGYVGPDEMHEKFERVKKAKLQVEARKVHPSEHFYSLDEWEARLLEISAQYNAAPQGGKMTGGLSPDDAFSKFMRADDPPTKLPASCRYLLAHHKRPLKVTSNGITLRFGNQAFNYRNEETGRLRGQVVLAWFNPELPESITVTDMNRENAFCVTASPAVPAMDATAEQLEDEFSRIAAHQSYSRVRYKMLRTKYVTPFRRAIVDGATEDLGRQIEAQHAQAGAERNQEERRQTKLRTLSRNLKMTISPTAARRPETLPAVERLTELLNEEETT
jgi:hypothetical protein